ncbi:PAS domain S-box protein [Paucibacter sp. Y2R2-4]|uniref:PAS domain S-box protein n=1 Tax=Paucibacter sp. Y2R2-4 TaxID=2893553 RepID=UPI0021E4511B|nr:PAS domain S-box protein [Paucibacter sp. Y2R2-4]MCV2352229.1 PAS domain S-box protein [Paucibacter sp. Y2R2-4]
MSEPPVSNAEPLLSKTTDAGLPAWMAYWPALVVGLAALALSSILLLARQAQDAAHAQNQLHQDLSAIRTRLEAVAQATFSPTLGLEAMIQLDGGISSARFEALAGRVVKLLPQVRSIVAAPDDIARYVYPLAGNQAVLNLDYRKIPVQYQQVQQAKRLGRPLLVGPVQLVQGGQGIIQRTPVFLPETQHLLAGANASPAPTLPANEAKPGYWGVISVVADLARFIETVGLAEHKGLRLALHQVQGEPQGRGELIWGDADLIQDAASVTQYVQMPGAVWALTAAPSLPTGPAASAHRYTAEIAASLLSSTALALLAALLVYRRRLLQAQNLALSKEVQQRAQSQNELQAAQTRFRSLAEISADWVWEQDEHLRFSFISRLADEHGEHDPQRLLGRYRWDSPNLSPDIDWDSHRALLARHEAFRDFEYSHLDDAGQFRFVSISGTPVFDAQGVFKGYRGTGRDISAARRAEAALRKSEQDLTLARDHLQAVLDAALEFSIIATDLQGRIGLFNRGAEQMLGYAEAEMLGHTPALIHLQSEVEARAAELSLSLGRTVEGFEAFVLQARECGIETRVWTYVRKDGSHLEVSLTVSCMQDSAGQAIGFLGIARDISAQRRAERDLVNLNASLETRVEQRTAELSRTLDTLKQAQMELLRAEKMAALGSLVAGIAHELNTPLGNCLTTASTLHDLTQQTRRNFEGGQMRRSVLDAYLNDADTACSILLRSMSTANELVSHFKQVSVDQTTAQRRLFSLVSVVDDVLSLLRPRLRKAGIALEVNAALSRELDSFPGPLGQVLTNLIMNAMLHAFDGESVEPLLTIRVEDLAGSPDGGESSEFLLIVEDNGAGMSSEVKRRAFDPFFTTKMGQGGTGLGLNIVYNIVTGILGGQIALNSEAQKGSRFTIRLPFVAPQLGGGADKLS